MTKLSRPKHSETVQIFGGTLSSKKVRGLQSLSELFYFLYFLNCITYNILVHPLLGNGPKVCTVFKYSRGKFRHDTKKIFKGQPIVQIFVSNIEVKRHGILLLTASHWALDTKP